MRRATTRILTTAAVLVTCGCRATRPSELPADPSAWIVAVKSCALPAGGAFWKSWAHHAWIDVKRGDVNTWERIESGGRIGIVHTDLDAEEARLDRRFGARVVRLLGWVDGDDARAAIARIDAARGELARRYGDDYTMWPGPNSNTFVRELLADVPELGFVFDPNAVGKDYSPWIGVSRTASKTGLRVDTPFLGAAVGFREGVELHVLQLTLGVSLDPPGLSLPFLPQIPWGWFGADDVRLRPPTIQGAITTSLDAASETGERLALGTGADEFVLVFARADERGWVRIDGRVTPAPGGLRSRDVELTIEVHEQDGVYSYGSQLRSDPLASAVTQRVQCEESVLLLEVRAVADGGVALAARCFASTEHEFEILSREPRDAAGSAGR